MGKKTDKNVYVIETLSPGTPSWNVSKIPPIHLLHPSGKEPITYGCVKREVKSKKHFNEAILKRTNPMLVRPGCCSSTSWREGRIGHTTRVMSPWLADLFLHKIKKPYCCCSIEVNLLSISKAASDFLFIFVSPSGQFQSICTARRFCLPASATRTRKKSCHGTQREMKINTNENTFHWKLAGWMVGKLVLKCEKPHCFSRLEILTRNESPVYFCPFQKLLQ